MGIQFAYHARVINVRFAMINRVGFRYKMDEVHLQRIIKLKSRHILILLYADLPKYLSIKPY